MRADHLLVGDLADTARLDQALVVHRIEAVVHFAALALVGESVRQPARYYHNNLVCSLGLMELLRRHAATAEERDRVPPPPPRSRLVPRLFG